MKKSKKPYSLLNKVIEEVKKEGVAKGFQEALNVQDISPDLLGHQGYMGNPGPIGVQNLQCLVPTGNPEPWPAVGPQYYPDGTVIPGAFRDIPPEGDNSDWIEERKKELLNRLNDPEAIAADNRRKAKNDILWEQVHKNNEKFNEYLAKRGVKLPPSNNDLIQVSRKDIQEFVVKKVDDERRSIEEYSDEEYRQISGGPHSQKYTPEIWKQMSLLKKRVEKIEKLPILRWFL